jgi:hypothetical protein
MDCNEAIYSNDYYDFIVQHDDGNALEGIEPCYTKINKNYSTIYRERATSPPLSIEEYSYGAIPKCLSPLDTGAMEAVNILQLQNQPALSLNGQGVLIGFLDTGERVK